MSYKHIINNKQVWIWGIGGLLLEYQGLLNPKLSIAGLCDRDIGKQGKKVELFGKEYTISAPETIKENSAVIIAVLDIEAERAIRSELQRRNIECCHILEAVDEYWTSAHRENTDIENSKREPSAIGKMVKFIDCIVPIDACNLSCSYCYIGQNSVFNHNRHRFHSPAYIRRALSRERMGGSIFINFCGIGETLLCKELLPIVLEITREGHYVQIVTNATITKEVERYLTQDIDLSHIFFKCSLHYLELKKRGLLEEFARNVSALWERGASISVELTPCDELVPYIDEIKEYSIKAFGAFPHLTVTRQEDFKDYRILTEYSYEEYKRIWSTFSSPMFDFKMAHIEPRRYEGCMAGEWAFQLNLETGEALACIQNKSIGNIYDLTKRLEFSAVKGNCRLPYCYNCHAYFTLGLVPEVAAPSYFEMRDRLTADDRHWINEEMRGFFSQKLYDNN